MSAGRTESASKSSRQAAMNPSASVFGSRNGIQRLKADGREHVNRARARGETVRNWSAVEDLLQVRLDLVLVHALRERQLLDEEVARGVEHLALAEREVLVELQEIQVAQHFGDLEHGACLDLLHVLAVAAVPGGGIDRDILLL